MIDLLLIWNWELRIRYSQLDTNQTVVRISIVGCAKKHATRNAEMRYPVGMV